MAFNKWSKQMTDKKRLSDESLNSLVVASDAIGGRRDDPSRTKRSDFLAIQDKINKALQDIDDIYDHTASNDPLINDIQSELDGMENGQFKLKLTSLIQKYNDQNAKVESMDSDRVQILTDLSDWFSMDHMDFGEPTGRNVEEVAEAKFEMAKFKEINEQLKDMKQEDPGFTDMEKERTMLQSKVTNAFKSLKENAQRQEVVRDVEKPPEQDGAWKHAAGEIVGLLGKVRQEGKDYITELEQKVKQLLKDMDDVARKLKRSENALAEKRQMEKKWKEESTKQTKEKAMMQSKLKKMKQELVKTRQLLGRHEVVAPVPGLGGSGVDIGGGNHDKEAEIHNLQSQLDTMKKENTAVQEQIKKLEAALEKKDEELSALEHDKLELLYQMKQAALRPNVKHLSGQSSNTSSVASLSLTVTSTTSVVIESKVTMKDQQKPSTEDRKGEAPKTPAQEICSKCKGDLQATPSETSKQPEPVPPPQEDEEKRSREQLEAEQQLKQQLEDAQKQVVKLEEQLVKAHQELLQAKSNPPSQAPRSTPVPQKGDSRPNTVGKSSKGKRGNTPRQGTSGKTNQGTEYEWSIIKDSEGQQQEVWIKNTVDDGIQVILREQCIQTDPVLDSLTNWSKPNDDNDGGWRPPAPPKNWVQFDPTTPRGPQDRRRSIDHSMLMGAEPATVKQQTDNTVFYIANQLTRMIEGITGFKDYIDIIVDRERTDMTRANNKLKSFMSPDELEVLDKETSLSQGSTTKDYKDLRSSLSAELEELSEMGNKDLGTDAVKKSMGIIVSKTIMMLAHTVERLREQIQEQYRQYECIHSALQRRPAGFQQAMEELLEEERMMPRLKRSRSLCALDEHGQEDQLESGLVGRYLNVPIEPNAQRSQSDIIVKENIMSGQPENHTASSRKAMQVSQATVPKKGGIQLTTTKTTNQTKAHYVQFGGFRDMEAQRRKTKPAPQNHNKLKKRQKELLNKNKGKVLYAKRPSRPVSDRLPADYFDGYTIGDLEQRVEEYGETLVNTEHMKAVEASADIRTDAEHRDLMGQTLPQIQHVETLPPLRPPRAEDDIMRLPPIKK